MVWASASMLVVTMCSHFVSGNLSQLPSYLSKWPPAVQGVSRLDAEMGTLRNLLTNSAVLVNALKEVAQPSSKPTAAQPQLEGSAPGARTDVDWAQTTDSLRWACIPAVCHTVSGLLCHC